jgi:hypothetical protein
LHNAADIQTGASSLKLLRHLKIQAFALLAAFCAACLGAAEPGPGEKAPTRHTSHRIVADKSAESAPPRDRLAGSYISHPSQLAAYCTGNWFDSSARHPLDDWQALRHCGRHLVEALRGRGHNALLLAVLSDGKAVYSSRLVPPSPTDEGSSLAAGLSDLVSKDPLERLFRTFDREGLVLVPELQFTGSLPAIEERLRQRGSDAGDERLVDLEGRRRADSGLGAPDYNILSPGVQEAVLQVVREFVETYKGHRSFGGVAFQLGSSSFLQLPGIDWGYDRETLRRFEQTTRTRIPDSSGAEGHREACRFLTTTARREWIRFRCQEVAAFHRKLIELVAAARPEARTFLSGILAGLPTPPTAQSVLDFVRAGESPAQLLGEQGLDLSQALYAQDPRVTVLRPLLQSATDDKPGNAAAVTLNSSPAIDALFHGARPGGLVTSLLPDSDSPDRRNESAAAAPQDKANDSGTPGKASAATARNVAHLLAALDAQTIFEPAANPPLTPVEAAREARRIFSALPAVPFRPAGQQLQPVTVRAAHQGNVTWLYAVNDSSLPLELDLTLNSPATVVCRSLNSGHPAALVPLATNQTRLYVDLDANAIRAWRMDRPGVEILATQLRISEEVLGVMRERLEHLNVQMHTAAASSRSGLKVNQADGPQVAGTEPHDQQLHIDQTAGTVDDLRQLTKTVSSVRLAWEERRYADCQRLLDGYWGQLLLDEPLEPAPVSTTRLRFGERLRNKFRR